MVMPTLQDRGDPLLASIRPMAAALPESGIVEVFNYGRERPGLIPFWVGEGDLPTPSFISEAAIQALREGHTFYTYQRGIPPLRQALSEYLGRHFEVAVEPERVIVTGSGMQAIQQTLQALAGPGDEVVVIAPVWPNIFAAVQMQEAVVRSVPLDFGPAGWQLDLDRLFAACGPRTRAIFVNSPGNPTGWIMAPEDMRRLRDFARARGLWIIADEVYARFVYDRPRLTSFLEITEPDERLIVTNTFSKNWAMTGWRIGWVVIPRSPALAQVYENLIQYNTSGVPAFLQYGCLAALTEGDGFVAELVARCRQGRELVCQALGELARVRLSPPAGAFYLFFRIDGVSDSTTYAKHLVDVANVGLAPGTAFGAGGEGAFRLCFAASHGTLRRGLERLQAALAMPDRLSPA